MSKTDRTTSGYARIPKGVWILGFVSLLMDTSSEMIHALLPLFLASTLGASVATIGLIEGIAEAMASITTVFSGALSDWIGKRKALAALGYGLAAMTKPLFAIAPSVGWLRGPASRTVSAREFAARRGTRWWPTFRRPACKVPASASGSR